MEGSWHDAMMKLMPNMKMDSETMKPGKVSAKMVEMMLKGWRDKYGNIPDVDGIDMSEDPVPATIAEWGPAAVRAFASKDQGD